MEIIVVEKNCKSYSYDINWFKSPIISRKNAVCLVTWVFGNFPMKHNFISCFLFCIIQFHEKTTLKFFDTITNLLGTNFIKKCCKKVVIIHTSNSCSMEIQLFEQNFESHLLYSLYQVQEQLGHKYHSPWYIWDQLLRNCSIIISINFLNSVFLIC